jgi:hypothetical protein
MDKPPGVFQHSIALPERRIMENGCVPDNEKII